MANFIFTIGLTYKKLGNFFCLRHSETKIWNFSHVKSKKEVF